MERRTFVKLAGATVGAGVLAGGGVVGSRAVGLASCERIGSGAGLDGPPPRPLVSDPFGALDASAQAALVRKGDVTPLELVDAAIARIQALNPAVNAVIHSMFDVARAQARSGDLPDGPFRGVPYLIKDLSPLAGQPLEFGSRLFEGHVACFDNGIVERAKAAGLVILGKTNTPEFGLLPTTESRLHGATRNPWSLERSCGGSSGGAAAAVASGMVPFAQGSDGGGSLRVPASSCGLVGLKPSRGRIHRGRLEVTPADIAVRLGITRSVRDTARLLAVSERVGDERVFDPVGMVDGPAKKRLKIALSVKDARGRSPHGHVEAATRSIAALCRELGHEVAEASLEGVDGRVFTQHFLAVWAAMADGVASAAPAIGLAHLQWTSAAERLEPFTLAMALRHSRSEAQHPGVVDRAIAYFADLTRAYERHFRTFDVELCPIVHTPPPLLGEHGPDVPPDVLLERLLAYVAYTPQHNAAGTPALSLPLSMSPDGLPIGTQFAAAPGNERVLLELAYELEAASPWKDRWPPHSAVGLSRTG